MGRLVPLLSGVASLVTIYVGWIKIKAWKREQRRNEKSPDR